VLFDNGPTSREVVDSAASSTIEVAKLCDDDTCNLYVVAPVAVFQLNVGLIGTFVEPFAGEESVGVDGAATIVVNEKAEEYAVVPPAFVALTRQ